MKKWMILAACVLLVAVAGGVIFKIKIDQMMKYFAEYPLKNADIQTIADGTYRGSFGKFVVAADLEANVKQHRIVDIKIISQKCGKGYEAKKILDRVLQAQSLKVDAIAGATGSSRCILIAIDRALNSPQAK
jgi:uncharacterized protein with FMN-binding domain